MTRDTLGDVAAEFAVPVGGGVGFGRVRGYGWVFLCGNIVRWCTLFLCRNTPEGVVRYSVRGAADLGLAIRDARAARGLTQAELAAEAGVSRAYLANVERGRSNRLIDLVFTLLRLLDLEVEVTRRGDGRG